MDIIVSLIGVFLILLGFGYLYKGEYVTRFNAWVREHVFNDRLLIVHRRKVGVFLVFIGAVILYLALR